MTKQNFKNLVYSDENENYMDGCHLVLLNFTLLLFSSDTGMESDF